MVFVVTGVDCNGHSMSSYLPLASLLTINFTFHKTLPGKQNLDYKQYFPLGDIWAKRTREERENRLPRGDVTRASDQLYKMLITRAPRFHTAGYPRNR